MVNCSALALVCDYIILFCKKWERENFGKHCHFHIWTRMMSAEQMFLSIDSVFIQWNICDSWKAFSLLVNNTAACFLLKIMRGSVRYWAAFVEYMNTAFINEVSTVCIWKAALYLSKHIYVSTYKWVKISTTYYIVSKTLFRGMSLHISIATLSGYNYILLMYFVCCAIITAEIVLAEYKVVYIYLLATIPYRSGPRYRYLLLSMNIGLVF